MKWIGCLILFYAVFQVGLKKADRLKHGVDLLFDIWYAVSEIGRQISVSQMPLPEIYRELAKKEQGRTDLFERLTTTGDFERVYHEVKGELVSSRALAHTMDSFFRTLGKTETATQCANCRETSAKLLVQLEEAQAGMAQRRKMYLTVAACIGGMLVLFVL